MNGSPRHPSIAQVATGHLLALLRRLTGLLLLGLALPGLAHKPSDSYLRLAVQPASTGASSASLEGQWDIALRDLDFAIGLDADGNGEITWGELRARHAEIAAYALARLSVQADDTPCTLLPGAQLVDQHSDGAYSVLPFRLDCPQLAGRQPEALTLTYRLFADLDPQHRGLLRLEAGARTRTAIFSPEAASQRFTLGDTSRWGQFTAYVRDGIWHIWVGFDHVLFLLALLLPAVLMRVPAGVGQRAGIDGLRWQAGSSGRQAVREVVAVVTAFTLAHSITLTLATFKVIALPSRWVEATIAASVALAALNNIFGLVAEKRWAVAFSFGLIHGFGFASVLADLGLAQGSLALALVGFNVGVELGQLVIVLLFMPLAWTMRHSRFYRWGIFIGGSLLIAALAGLWFAERAFLMVLLPR